MLRLAWAGKPELLADFLRIAPRLRDAALCAVAHPDAEPAWRAPFAAPEIPRAATLGGLARSHPFDAAILDPQALARDPKCDWLAGKTVLLEHALALEPSSLEAIVHRCEAAKARMAVGGSWRFHAAALSMRASLDAGSLGIPGLVRLHHWCAAPTAPTSANGAGCAALTDRAAVAIDLCCWILGAAPQVVFATAPGLDCDHGALASLQVHLGFAEGGMALVEIAEYAALAQPYDALTVIGSAGAAYFDDHANAHLLLGSDQHRAFGGQASAELARLRELQAFVDAAAGRQSFVCTTAEALRAARVAAAARQSLKTGQPVPIGEVPA